MEPAAKAAIEVLNLRPGEDRLVVLRRGERRIGVVVNIQNRDDARRPVIVTLKPLATIMGRAVDPDGSDVPGATIRPMLLPGGDFGTSWPQLVTDAEDDSAPPTSRRAVNMPCS